MVFVEMCLRFVVNVNAVTSQKCLCITNPFTIGFAYLDPGGTASSAGATWLSILSIFILCVAPARFLNQDKKIRGSGQQVQEKYLIKSR